MGYHDQIMQACHWKENDNNMYLGPEVAAQQDLDPSPQRTHLQEEKKGRAHPLQPSLQDSIPGYRYWLPLLDVHGKVYLYVFNCIMYLVFISVP